MVKGAYQIQSVYFHYRFSFEWLASAFAPTAAVGVGTFRANAVNATPSPALIAGPRGRPPCTHNHRWALMTWAIAYHHRLFFLAYARRKGDRSGKRASVVDQYLGAFNMGLILISIVVDQRPPTIWPACKFSPAGSLSEHWTPGRGTFLESGNSS